MNARKIIGSNAIAAVTSYDVRKHISWVKQMENVLLLNGAYFHEKFFNCIKYNDVNIYKELREEIINHYSNINNFILAEPTVNLFIFPKFKNRGHFHKLDFGSNDDDPNYNDNDDDNNYDDNLVDFERIDQLFRLLLLMELGQNLLDNLEENN